MPALAAVEVSAPVHLAPVIRFHAAREASLASDRLVAELAVHLSGQANRRDEIARQLLESGRLKRMVAQHEFDLGLTNERDEIVQGTILVFLDKYLNPEDERLAALDRPENVYTLLYTVSRNVALGVKGTMFSHDHRYQPLTAPASRERRSMHPVDEELPMHEPAMEVEMATEDFREQVESAIDRQRAEDKLGPRFAAMGAAFWADLDKKKPEPAAPVARVNGKRVLIKDAKELLRIRNMLHLSNQKMALSVGIEHPLFCAYIYGRTKKIPERVMQEARDLVRKNGDAYKQVLQRLGKRSMRRIVSDWLTALGQPSDQGGLTALGKVLGVNWHTVRRWHDNEFKPTLPKLQVLEEKLFHTVPRRRLLAAYRGALKAPPKPRAPAGTAKPAAAGRTPARPAVSRPRTTVRGASAVSTRRGKAKPLAARAVTRKTATRKAQPAAAKRKPVARAKPKSVQRTPARKRPVAKKKVAAKPTRRPPVKAKAVAKPKSKPKRPPAKKARPAVKSKPAQAGKRRAK